MMQAYRTAANTAHLIPPVNSRVRPYTPAADRLAKNPITKTQNTWSGMSSPNKRYVHATMNS